MDTPSPSTIPIGAERKALHEIMGEYKKDLDKCKNPPSKGGYSITELRAVAKRMGVDTSIYNTRKEICQYISEIDIYNAYTIKQKQGIMKGFVTLDDYVSTERALGPKAKAAHGYGHYQSWGLINTFMAEIVRRRLGRLVCVPIFSSLHPIAKIPYKSMVFISQDTGSMFFNEAEFKSALAGCRQRFVMIGVSIIFQDGHGHATMLVIDRKLKLIEHFDPEAKALNRKIENRMVWFVKRYFPKYTYTMLWDICPIFPQRKADAWEGMCITYSIMYLLLRILNPDVPTQKVFYYLTTGGTEELQARLLKFHKYMEETIKGAYKQRLSH